MKNIDAVKSEINELEQEILHLQGVKDCLEATEYIRKATNMLHLKLCHENHNTECSYHMDSWDDPMDDRIKYLCAVRKLLAVTTPENLPIIVDIISNLQGA